MAVVNDDKDNYTAQVGGALSYTFGGDRNQFLLF